MNTSQAIIQKLQVIASRKPMTIKTVIAQEALNRFRQDIQNFHRHLYNEGCENGFPSFASYETTEDFFDDYYEEIFNIKIKREKVTGVRQIIPFDVANILTLEACLYIILELAEELGLEI